jgi:hypothetical protein
MSHPQPSQAVTEPTMTTAAATAVTAPEASTRRNRNMDDSVNMGEYDLLSHYSLDSRN